MSLLTHILHASWMVQMVIVCLILQSCYSWSLIIKHSKSIWITQKQADSLLNNFWQSECLQTFCDTHQTQTHQLPSSLLCLGYHTYQETPSIPQMHRRIDIAYARWIQSKAPAIAHLATISTLSPYIGLLGTVCGIIHAFNALSGVSQVSLAMIAPGISEALITTALGLLVAIPAAMAYNRFRGGLDHLDHQLDTLKNSLAFTLTPHEQ